MLHYSTNFDIQQSGYGSHIQLSTDNLLSQGVMLILKYIQTIIYIIFQYANFSEIMLISSSKGAGVHHHQGSHRRQQQQPLVSHAHEIRYFGLSHREGKAHIYAAIHAQMHTYKHKCTHTITSTHTCSHTQKLGGRTGFSHHRTGDTASIINNSFPICLILYTENCIESKTRLNINMFQNYLIQCQI